MKFIEVFAGIGGFRLGLERQGHECVWANEWLEKPRGIYEYNFKEKPDDRDIRTISGEDVPRADLIVGGFPCATFSVAGKRTGFSLDDTRGTLCFEMFKIAKQQSIPYIMFENVKGLLNHDSGRTFAVILSALDEMGYDSQWELLDSQHFGVPQHRERIFLIANLRGQPRPKVFPIGSPNNENGEKSEAKQGARQGFFSNISPTLDAHYYKGGAARQYVVSQYTRKEFREFKSDGVSTLTVNMGTGGHNVPFLTAPETFEKIKMSMLSHTKANIKQRTQERDTTWALDTHPQNNMALHTKMGIRKLTPLECERLQGLPDNFTKYRIKDGEVIENSDNERYERCGRTVTIPVIEAIGKKLGREWYA